MAHSLGFRVGVALSALGAAFAAFAAVYPTFEYRMLVTALAAAYGAAAVVLLMRYPNGASSPIQTAQ
jgi:hypothetical protein